MRAQAAHDVPLHAEVVRGDLQPPRRTALGDDAELVGILFRPVERLLGGDLPHQIRAFHLRERIRAVDQRLDVERVAGRDHAAHHAARPQQPCQRPRIDVGDGDDAVGDQVVAQRRLGAPVARHRRLVADDEPRHLRLARFDVVLGHAVVADLGARHRDDLAGVGRIREDLLVAGEARVEHDLPAGYTLSASRGAAEGRSIFESENGFHLLLLQ